MMKKAVNILGGWQTEAMKNPSLLELAALSEAVYDNIDSVGVDGKPATAMPALARPAAGLPARLSPAKIIWARQSKWWNRLGFYAALYSRQPDGKRVLAFRGTDEFWTDGLIDDVSVAAGAPPPQAAAAFQVARDARLPEDSFLTGHSLGGALAIIAGARLGLPVVTFNAPGVMDSCVVANAAYPGTFGRIVDAVARCFTGRRMWNIRIPEDPVSSFFTTGFQPGKRIELSAPECSALNVKCRHGIGTCVELVKKRTDAHDEVKL